MKVNNPASPQLAGSYVNLPNASDVAVSGQYAYVVNGYAGLHVIDVSNPATPQRVGGYDTSGFAQSVAAAGDHAGVAEYFFGVVVICASRCAQSPPRLRPA